MKDKIALIIEETGCDPSEAELALSLSDFEVPKAVQLLERMLKNILVISGKFRDPDRGAHGLFLVIFDVKTSMPLRQRALLSLNPAVFSADPEQDWFDFERQIYAERLGEGSLIEESLSFEQALLDKLRGGGAARARLMEGSVEEASREIAAILKDILRTKDLSTTISRKLISLSHYREFKSRKSTSSRRRFHHDAARAADLLVLDVRLVEDPQGVPARDLRASDTVWVSIPDKRDIAQYLARLLGAVREGSASPIEATIEAVESVSRGVLVRVRLSGEVCGDAMIYATTRIQCLRQTRFYTESGLTIDEK